MKLLIQQIVILLILTIPMYAMELAPQNHNKIPSLKDLCLPFIPEVIAKKCNPKSTYHSLENKQILDSIMQKIPNDLHPKIISACAVPTLKKRPKDLILPLETNTLRAISSNNTLACLTHDRTLSVINMHDNTVIKEITYDAPIIDALFSDDAKYVACLSNKSMTMYELGGEWNQEIWDTKKSNVLVNLDGFKLHAFNGKALLATSPTETDIFVRCTKHFSRLIYPLHDVKKSFFCSDNLLVLSFKKDYSPGMIAVYDVALGENIKTLNDHTKAISDIKGYSNNNTIVLASASKDKTVRICDISKPNGKECIATLEHICAVDALCFSPNGKVMLTGINDNSTISLWDIQSEQRIASYTYNDDTIPSLRSCYTFQLPTDFISWSSDGNSFIVKRGKNHAIARLSSWKIPYAILGRYLATLLPEKEA